MNTNEWVAAIDGAIRCASHGSPGRAGQTPLTELAEKLREVDPAATEYLAAERAFVRLIQHVASEDDDRWQSLLTLLQLSPFQKQSERIRNLLLVRLANDAPNDTELRAFALAAVAALGYRFEPSALDQELEIMRRYPLRWLDLWIRAGHFRNFEQTLLDRLRGIPIDGKDLLARLPSWYQNPDVGSDVGKIAANWQASLGEDTYSQIRRWFRTRKIPLPERQAAARPAGAFSQPGDGTAGSDFLNTVGEFVRSTKRSVMNPINGQPFTQ